MRRRLPLTILAVLAIAVMVALAMKGTRWPDRSDRAAVDRPDSLARADSIARVRAASAEEPPCVASRVGLPCR